MYKVFVNDKLIKLIDDYADYKSENHSLFLRFSQPQELLFAIKLLRNNERLQQLVVFHNELDELWSIFRQQFRMVHASGGLVRNENNEVLFIFKRGSWDLPKGKIDNGEDKQAAAIREVKEECGIDSIEVLQELIETFHIYEENNEMCIKHTNWFEMKSDYEGSLKGDEREGIEKVEWISADNVEQVFQNTFPSIIEVFNAQS